MDIKKIVALTDSELVSHGIQAREQIFRIRFQKALGNIEGLKKLRGLKLDVARTETVLKQRSQDASSASSPSPAGSKGKGSKGFGKSERKSKI